ncbi:hypothetical protein XENTR_v10003544 [Xenopus tropicalis]|nr:hypothetical protein XENTR_v10003544 [Xenopus tropicalis]
MRPEWKKGSISQDAKYKPFIKKTLRCLFFCISKQGGDTAHVHKPHTFSARGADANANGFQLRNGPTLGLQRREHLSKWTNQQSFYLPQSGSL